MSHHGRLCVAYIDRGEREVAFWLRYANRLTPDERRRIGRGDHRAITRPLEPAFTEAQQITVSWWRTRAVAVRQLVTLKDRGDLTGEVIPSMKVPSFAIELAKPRRHRKGHWLIPFRVIKDDRAATGLYLMPASHAVRVDDEGRALPMSEAEEHGMTTNPADPVGAGGVLSGAEYETVIQMPSRLRQAERPTSTHERRSQERAVRETLHRALEGLSPIGQAVLLAGIKRQIEDAVQADADAA